MGYHISTLIMKLTITTLLKTGSPFPTAIRLLDLRPESGVLSLIVHLVFPNYSIYMKGMSTPTYSGTLGSPDD